MDWKLELVAVPVTDVDRAMRVLTWNLQWRERADWRSRQPGIVSTLDSLRPDVAGLQEVWATSDTTLADELAGRLGMHAAFAAPSLPPPGDPPSARTRPASWPSC
jgi:endonuclease/exonuclease/phosphatase family metal-dependent hydrolase